MEFPETLRELLDDRGISQQRLAELTGVTGATISRTVSGNSDPGAKLLLSIAEALDVSIDFLMGRTANPNVGGNKSQIEYIIGHAYLDLDRRDKQIIRDVVGEYLTDGEMEILLNE